MKTLQKIALGLSLAIAPYLTGCVYPIAKEIKKSEIEYLLASAPHTFYTDNKGRILADREGGLELDTNSEWEKTSQEKINISNLIAKGAEATTLSIKDTRAGLGKLDRCISGKAAL